MVPSSITTPAQLRDAYRRLKERIADAALRSGRSPHDVLLVAVTKYASPDQIRTLIELGQVDLGENRVQHLIQRVAQVDEFMARKRAWTPQTPGLPASAAAMPAEVRWHMIGSLQRNKAKPVVPLVRLIHSVDSLRLAEELHALGPRFDKPIEVLIQVNVSGEDSKHGVAVPAALPLAEQIDTMVHLRLRGLMTMAPYSDDPEHARPHFVRCRELFEEIRDAGLARGHFNILSMGMSGDYEVAIEEGANLVRVGRALFGENDTETPDEPA